MKADISTAQSSSGTNAEIEFISDSGTPEVTFHQRLSLRRRNTELSRPSTSYQREVIDIVDSDDEELEMAIQASLQEYEMAHEPDTEKKSLNEILTQLYARWVSDKKQTIIVSRRNVMESAFRALERESNLLHGKPYIKFSGEIGEDCGGPRREFFRTKISGDVDLLEKGWFRLAGQLIALSFLHDGPSPHFLDPTVFSLMLGEECNMKDFNTSCLPTDVKIF